MLRDILKNNLTKTEKIIFDIHADSSMDFLTLMKRAALVISYFKSIKHTKRDKVILFLENSIDYIVILIALFEVDIVVIPLNPKLNRIKVDYILAHSQARFLITSPEILKKNIWLKGLSCQIIATDKIFRPSLDSGRTSHTLPERQSDNKNLKFIIYTSGTIGNPKGVMLSEDAVRSKVLNLVKLLNLRPSSSFFSFLPFFSAHGMVPGMLVPLFSGCRLYIARFDPFLAFSFWEIIKKYNINYFTSVPGILSLLKENLKHIQKEEIKCIYDIFSASSQLPQVIYDWYDSYLGIKIRNCYGLTETASWISANLGDNPGGKANCIGRAFNADIGVFDKKGDRLGNNETGEFWVKSPSNMLGYYKNRKETKSAITSGGYIKTGDIGCIDSDGNIFILDRIKNIIIRNGINIYPLEIDQVFLGHPAVKESSTFGVPDENYGEKVITALIISDNNKSKDKYLKYAIDKLPSFLVPNDILFPDSFSKSPTGKIATGNLREQYLREK